MNKTQYLFLIIVVMLLTACRQSARGADSSDVQVDLRLNPVPAAVGASELVIEVRDAQGQPVNDASLQVKGDMTHAGMTPVLAEMSGGENGVYVVPFEWTMAGDWIITVDVTLSDGTLVTRRFEQAVQGNDPPVNDHDDGG